MFSQLFDLHVCDLRVKLFAARQIQEAAVFFKLTILQLLILLCISRIVFIAWAQNVLQHHLINLRLKYLRILQDSESIFLGDFSLGLFEQVSNHISDIVSMVADLRVLGGLNAYKWRIVDHGDFAEDLSFARARPTMDKNVRWAHRFADFTINLSHTVLIPDSLCDDPLGFFLADDVLVELGNQL